MEKFIDGLRVCYHQPILSLVTRPSFAKPSLHHYEDPFTKTIDDTDSLLFNSKLTYCG